eukprot:Gb_05710 [translate_table: standard]
MEPCTVSYSRCSFPRQSSIGEAKIGGTRAGDTFNVVVSSSTPMTMVIAPWTHSFIIGKSSLLLVVNNFIVVDLISTSTTSSSMSDAIAAYSLYSAQQIKVRGKECNFTSEASTHVLEERERERERGKQIQSLGLSSSDIWQTAP